MRRNNRIACRESRLTYTAWSPAMLNVHLPANSRYCDGISRRSMLKLGACTLGGLSLARLFEAEAAAGIGSSSRRSSTFTLAAAPATRTCST
jgi:hypothetical protein